MAKNRGIRLRFSSQRLEALIGIADTAMTDFVVENDHHKLLKSHLIDLRAKFKEMRKRNQEMYLLTLVGTEAIAFYQLWNMLDISSDKYAVIIVNDLLRRIQISLA